MDGIEHEERRKINELMLITSEKQNILDQEKEYRFNSFRMQCQERNIEVERRHAHALEEFRLQTIENRCLEEQGRNIILDEFRRLSNIEEKDHEEKKIVIEEEYKNRKEVEMQRIRTQRERIQVNRRRRNQDFALLSRLTHSLDNLLNIPSRPVPVSEIRLPTNRVRENDKIEKCSICLEMKNIGCKIKRLPCFHTFHVVCINKWLHVKMNCPLCLIEVG